MKTNCRRGFFFIPVVIGGIFLFGFIVMQLWNGILPQVAHVGTLTYWQALGLLALSKILFGGFRGGWGGGGGWRYRMHNKWQQMTPEDREKFKEEWKRRCGSWKSTE